MKIALISNINIDLLPGYLSKKDAEKHDYYLGSFNQYMQELLRSDSGLYRFKPEVIIVHIDGSALFEQQMLSPFEPGLTAAMGLVEAQRLFEAVLASTKMLPHTSFLLNTIVIHPKNILGSLEYNSTLSLKKLELNYNNRLTELKASLGSPNIMICGWDSVVHSIGAIEVYDRRYWYLGRIPYSTKGFVSLANLYVNAMRTFSGKSKKLIALDLDNTLWGGIIGEDGLSRIQLGEDGIGKAFRDFQKLLKGLKYKGILLAVVSKNNIEDAFEVLTKHPDMVLRTNDFVSIKCDWKPKSYNLKLIAEELNLGLSSFVMIDDNPVERMEVSTNAPGVVVPEFPNDPTLLVEWLIELNFLYFDKLTVTDEDAKRTEMYKSNFKRKELELTSPSIEHFLRSLEMKVKIRRNSSMAAQRIAQLTQRTNQFNMTTRRYTESEIKAFMEGSQTLVYDLQLDDKFGTNGTVGVIIIKTENDTAIIDTFLLSCRVLGREVEKAFVAYVLRDLNKKGHVRKVIGEFIPTDKNVVSKEVYKKLGFELLKSSTDCKEVWQISMGGNLPEIPEYIEVRDK